MWVYLFKLVSLVYMCFFIYPGVELLDQMEVQFFIFRETLTLFSTVDEPVYILPSSVQGLSSPHPLQHLLLALFEDGRSDRKRRRLTAVLVCVPLRVSGLEHLFTCPLAVCVPLWNDVYSVLPHNFLTGLFMFLMLSCMSCLYMLDINPRWSYRWQISSPR